MIAGRPYERVRPSGVEWLGDVPEHWKVGRLKSFAQIDPPLTRRPTADETATFLPMERVSASGRFDGSLRRHWDEIGTYTPFERGDVLLAKITPCFENGKAAFLGGLPTQFGFGSTEFIVVRARPGTDPQLLFRALHLEAFRQLGRTVMKGSAGQQRVSPSFVANQPFAFPPPDEQAAIVRFLDHAVGRLDRAIAAKRRVVRLLEEQRRAIVHRAVTRGLDPHAPMKDSGVPWLGEVPAEWNSLRGKNIWGERDERSITGTEELLSVSHLTGVTARSEKNITMFKAASYVGSKLCEPGDLVINTMWAWMGAMGVSPRHGIVSPSYGVYAPIRQCDPTFLEWLVTHPAYVALYGGLSTGVSSSRARLYPETFLAIRFHLPTVQKQREIVKHVETETYQFGSAKAKVEREIALLEEYRTALVSEVVTGKRDVREAAARLPDAPPPVALDGGDDGDPLDFEVGEDDLDEQSMEDALA